MLIPLLAAIGIAICVYTLYVSHRARKSPSYRPLCEISQNISCLRAFTSEHARTLGIENAYLGIVFYVGCIISSLAAPSFLVPLTFAGALFSAYLGTILLAVQHNRCVVCLAAYAINFTLFGISIATSF